MQHAYIRVTSVFKHAGVDESNLTLPLVMIEGREIALAARLLQFEEAITVVAREGSRHVMCSYPYDLAGLLSGFYEHCQILNAESGQARQSRLKLVLLAANTLKTGLETLSIDTVAKI